MSTEKANALVDRVNADVEAFVSTLSPDEAMCMTRKVLGVAASFLEDHPAMPLAVLHQLVHTHIAVAQQISVAALGATVDHWQQADACKCSESVDFFTRIGAIAVDIAQEAAS